MTQFTLSRDGEITDMQQERLIANRSNDQIYDDWWAGTGDETIEGVPPIQSI